MEQKQQIASTARVARGAVLVGEVTLGEESSVWYNAVVRADNAPIVIGARSNIQDCCVLHVDEGHPIQIGDGVTVGHGAICTAAPLGTIRSSEWARWCSMGRRSGKIASLARPPW